MGIFDTLKRVLFGPGVPPKPEPEQDRQPATIRATPAPATGPPRLTAPEPVQRAPERPQRAHSVSEGPQESKYLPATEQRALLVPDEDGVLPVTIRDGFFVYIPTGQMMPPANRVLDGLGVFSFRVRGTQHYRGAESADTSPGQPAILRREPDNEFDPNAVAVWARNPSGRAVRVGYVNKGLARRLAKRLDAGENIDGVFMRGDAPGVWAESPCVALVDEVFRRRIPGWPSGS